MRNKKGDNVGRTRDLRKQITLLGCSGLSYQKVKQEEDQQQQNQPPAPLSSRSRSATGFQVDSYTKTGTEGYLKILIRTPKEYQDPV